MKALRITVVALTTVFVLFGQEGAINSQKDLREAIATAKTQADHARIASYYRRAANRYTEKETEEEAIADQWKAQYENWTKTPNPYHTAATLANYYGQMARDAQKRAAEQTAQAGLTAAIYDRGPNPLTHVQ